MQIKQLLSSIVLSFVAAGSLYAQNQAACLTDIHNQELLIKTGQTLNRSALEQEIQAFKARNPNHNKIAGTVYQIPTVIHVVSEKGCASISKAQVLNGLEIVNQDFRRQNPDAVNTRTIFLPYAADTEIEFVLAKLDPNGNATDGIIRETSPAANAPYMRDNVKTASPAWPTDKYFNIWIVDKISTATPGSEAFGYSQFPGLGAWNMYGSVIVHSQWGKMGAVTNSSAISDGRYATHEIAHSFNLYHDFGCNANSVCGGDMCGDTPPANPTIVSGCNYNLNTCSLDVGPCSPYTTDVPDQIENYMYMSDCTNMFTTDQKNRMRSVIDLVPQLTNLISPANFVVTGIDPSMSVSSTIKPEPYFCVSTNQICAGSSVDFTDISFNAPVQSRTWTFPGGTPATSATANPVVTYSSPGVYPVELEVGNSNGLKKRTVAGYIKVVPVANLVQISPPNYFVESFENTTFPANINSNLSWSLQSNSIAANPLNWERVTTAFSEGTSSLLLKNSQLTQGMVSSLITPNFALSSTYLLFDLAYAKKTNTPTEELRIYASTDCGQNWTQIKAYIGNMLVTNGGSQVSGNFVPTAAHWRMEQIPLYSYAAASHIMFKIEGKSNTGGNLYIDNFRLGNVLSASEDELKNYNVTISPNPVTAQTQLNFNLQKPETVSFSITDVTGKTVYQSSETTYTAGKNSIALSEKLQNAQAGIYLVQVKAGNKLVHSKLVKH